MFFPRATSWPWSGNLTMPAYQQQDFPVVSYPPSSTQSASNMQWQHAPMATAQAAYFAPPPAYPASNQPAVWNRLQPYIEQSPTLSRQLAQLSNAGWSVHWNPHQGALCTPAKRQISIDPTLADNVVMQYLAHEIRHALETPPEARFYASDVAYASVKMRNEAVAVLNHMQVRSEIFQASGQDIGFSQAHRAYYESAVNFCRKHGDQERLLQHIQRHMAWDEADVELRPYWEVYLNFWRTGHGLPPVTVPPAMSQAHHAQAWYALAAEMNAG